MNGTLGKVLCLKNDIIFKKAFPLLRFKISGENPICSAGGILLSTSRHYRSRPTHGIGRYKHLIQAQEISGLSATFAEIFLEIIQSNLPEGVKLSVKEHSEEDFKGRFKARPELEELIAKLN
uniref:Mitochondrial ribosomal protein L48 n=1 Tax=Pipistrellus kuhlii TaxID=59472 RepID=A0A7J7X0I6_PIPKU|nr:mitochondrial ribosomal protein L48 [Pipistrellus kuhlii]